MEEQFPREDNNIIRAKVFATCQGFFCNLNASTKIYNRFIDIIAYPSLYKHYAIVSGIISFIF
jgi:hypothetical protein